MNIDNILKDLINSLKASDPYKIILFGSYARGKETDDSDIDLMVILDNNDVAKNYKERQNKKLHIRRLVRKINYKAALDRGFPKTSVLGKLPWIYVEKADFRPLFPKACPKTVRF
jgi:predicted nucleotidyltransferase